MERIMEEKEIFENEEVASISISPEKEQTVHPPFLPIESSFTKSYSKTRIESIISDHAWEIDQFVRLSKTIDMLHSPTFPETDDYIIQMNVIRKTESPLSTIQFYLLPNKAFTGLCTTTIIFPHGATQLSRSISGHISNMALLCEITDSQYKHCNDTDTLVVHCKLEIFCKLISNTIHLNLQPASTSVFSEDMRSVKDSILYKFDGTTIKFIMGKEQYVISKELLRATNSNYFKNICLTHEGKEKDMTNELTDSELQAFQEMLVFITTGSIRSNNYDMIKKLLTTADKYDSPTLKLMCEQYLLRYITVCNAIELIQLAFSYNAKFLETHSATFIKFHIKEIMNTKEFQNLPQESANKIMELIEKCEVIEIITDQFFSTRPRNI